MKMHRVIYEILKEYGKNYEYVRREGNKLIFSHHPKKELRESEVQGTVIEQYAFLDKYKDYKVEDLFNEITTVE